MSLGSSQIHPEVRQLIFLSEYVRTFNLDSLQDLNQTSRYRHEFHDGMEPSRNFDRRPLMGGGRSRTYGGYSDTEDPRMLHPEDAAPYSSGRVAGAPRMAGRGVSYDSGTARLRGSRHDHGLGGEYGMDSDMESVISATSAFSSQSAPHARPRRHR